jgi:hypothetical protein
MKIWTTPGNRLEQASDSGSGVIFEAFCELQVGLLDMPQHSRRRRPVEYSLLKQGTPEPAVITHDKA